MSGQVEFNPRSWLNAAEGFDDAAQASSRLVQDVVAATTDAGACGAAGGLSTVDGALAIMLQVFGQVMHEQVLTPYVEGVASEAAAMDAIAQDYQTVEADSQQLAGQAGREVI